MQFDRGYLSPYFVTDPERMEVVLENPFILIHEKKISVDEGSAAGARAGRAASAARCSSSPRISRAKRWRRSSSTSCAARSRSPRSRRPASAIAARRCSKTSPILTSGKAITEDLGIKLEIDQAGGPRPGEEDHDRQGQHHDRRGRRQRRRRSRAASSSCASQVEDTTSDYDREKLQERLAKLVGGVAIIKVGAATETEMKEKKARVEDAMHATKAAVEEGIVPGGGVALLRAAKALEDLKLDGDEQIGVEDRRRAIEEPMRWIATNAGHEGAIVVQRVKEMKADEGFNAQTGSTRTWCRRASSIRPKWSGPRCRTPRRSRRCC